MATLIEDRDLERDHRLSDGRIITTVLEDDLSQITFRDKATGEELSGEFVFEENPESMSEDVLLARMYSPIKYEGLGEAALRHFTEYTGKEVFVRPNDGIPLDDGSHLTEDAPRFVNKMRRLGLIIEEDDGYDPEQDDEKDESSIQLPEIDDKYLDDLTNDPFLKDMFDSDAPTDDQKK